MLKVSSTSDPTATGGAIANGIREAGEVELQVIGPRAVNQAVKAIAVARGYLAASGVDLYFIPAFADVRVGKAEKVETAIRLLVRPRHGLPVRLGRPSPS